MLPDSDESLSFCDGHEVPIVFVAAPGRSGRTGTTCRERNGDVLSDCLAPRVAEKDFDSLKNHMPASQP
jgi:hypothetical protein